MTRILITGAFGRCGTALLDLPGELVLFDVNIPDEHKGRANVIQGNIQDQDLLVKSMQGCSAVIHLAGSARVDSSWDAVVANNIIGTQVVVRAAQICDVERVLFASTNHVFGMVEIENKPEIYRAGHGIKLTNESELRPDSYYATSKIFGEALGRYSAENGDPKFYALRIGSLHSEGNDHPYAEAEAEFLNGRCERGDTLYQEKVDRQKALWLSRRDFRQIVKLSLAYQGPRFDAFFAVSNNPNRWLDIEHAREQLGYQPQDNAETWMQMPNKEAA